MTTSDKAFYPPVVGDATSSTAAASPAVQGSVVISITSPAIPSRPQITIMSQAMEQVYQGPASDIPDALRQYVAEAFDLVYHPRSVPTFERAPAPPTTAATAADPPSYVDTVTPESQRVYSRALDSKLSAKQQLRESRRVAKQTIREVRKMVKEQRRAVHAVARAARSAKREAKQEAKLAKEDAKLQAKRAKLLAKSNDRSLESPLPFPTPISPAGAASSGDAASSKSAAKTVRAVPEGKESNDGLSLVVKVLGQEFRFGKAKSSQTRTRRDSLSSVSTESSSSSDSSLSSDSEADGDTDSDYDKSLYVPAGSLSTAAMEVGRGSDEKKPMS